MKIPRNQPLHRIHSYKTHSKILITLKVCIALIFHTASSQQKTNSNINFTPTEIWEAGLPHIENYSATDYRSSTENWAFAEGNDGFIYVGNTKGVLQFDGKNWSTLELENKSSARSLAKTDDGKIYVGGTHELGYFEPNKMGEMQFHSLLPKIEAENRTFGDVWRTMVIDNKVFFISNKHLFRWDGKEIKVWKPKNRFGYAYKVNNTLYLESKTGIHKLDGDVLNLVPGGDFLNDKRGRIFAMLPHADNKVLIADTFQGLLLYDGEKITSFNQESQGIFLKHKIYAAIILNNRDYAVATLSSGLYIVDGKTGMIKKRLGKKQGLASDVLFSVFQDSHGAIWVGGDNGISKIDWTSPFRILNKLSALDERIKSVSYNHQKFLVGTKGLHYLIKSDSYKENNEVDLKKINKIEERISHIVPFDDALLALDHQLVYKINDLNEGAELLEAENWGLMSVIKSAIDSSKIYVGTIGGILHECTFSKKTWSVKRLLKIDGGIGQIQEESNGDLWLQTYYKGLYLAQKQYDSLGRQAIFNVKKYDTLSGLPSMSNNFIYRVKNKLHVTTEDGMYYFNKKKRSFEKDSSLEKKYHKNVSSFGYMKSDKKGRIWQAVKTGFENKIYTFSEDKSSELQEYNLYADFEPNSIEFLDDIVLFIGAEGILLYDQNKTRSFNENLSTSLREVWVNNHSLIYSGFNGHKNKEDGIEIPYKDNTLKFEYTLPFYSKSQKNVYQYLLEGFDNDWSQWTTETRKDFTNLTEGHYSFKVRAKNIFNQKGQEDSYSFSILPPWQRTWWAYLSYCVGAIALVSLLLKWRSKELKRKNENLETIVSERTTEIRHKNQLLNHQTEQLEQLNDSKTRLYSNITHEFRTPLTVILGMADTLKTNVKEQTFEDAETAIEMIRRNGKNLLQLVNEMLDLAKVESGSMELNLVQTDAIPFVKYLSESFHSLAESKKINLTVYSEINALEMDIDVNKMASIISNLLSNAIKFTGANGKIIVHLNKIEIKENDIFSIKVQDNGVGLTEDDMTRLFDRFYQADNESSQYQEGTGIGLSLAKEFVELMNGTIEVESTLGKGSTFIVQLPVTHNAIKTVDAKITTVSPVQKNTPSTKTVPSPVDATSELPLALIIEDNEDVAHYLKTCLKGKYRTIHAINGTIGVEMAYERIPDIIISDVMMPGKDGFEVCATLKTDERTDHVPIILLTAKVTTEDRLTGLSHGADAYLAKPFNQEELFTRLDQLILVRKKLIGKLEKNGLSFLLKEKVEHPQSKFLKQVIKSVHNHLDDAKFGPSQLANEMRLSESQIYRKLKSITDKSTAIFMRSVRLQKAKELIETTDKTISEIAYEVGFNDPSWFSRAFKKEFNLTPSDIHR